MSRTRADLDALHAEEPRCLPIVLDITDLAATADVVRALEAEHGPCAVLINNAGYGLRGAMEDIDLVAWRAQFELNLFAAMHLAQCVLPGMRSQGSGVIVQISSVAARVATPISGAYSATKFALKAASDALRVEVAPFGIRVVQVEPGPVRTDFVSVAAGHSGAILGREDSVYTPMYEVFATNLAKLHADAWSAERVADRILDGIDHGSPRVGAHSFLLTVSIHLAHIWPRLLDRLMASRMGTERLGGR